MKRLQHWIILLSIPALVQALPAMGAVQMFLDVPDIPGDSTTRATRTGSRSCPIPWASPIPRRRGAAAVAMRASAT